MWGEFHAAKISDLKVIAGDGFYVYQVHVQKIVKFTIFNVKQ